MIYTPPTPEEQILFLRNIQRLLAEGQFTASYKFALLHALADLAVLEGDDSGAPLELSTRAIAEKFVELYWEQCRPFEFGGQSTGFILQQNTGQQAAVVCNIIEARQRIDASLFQIRHIAPDIWRSLIANVNRTICAMPLWKLQTVGAEHVEFLYPNLGRGTSITLRPGVPYCLRAYYGLLRDLIQGAWIRFVQQLNAERLGNLTDLGTFLFGQERSALDAYRPILRDIQSGQCFYCRGTLYRDTTHVDHFVPWVRYSTDLGHNFVLSHASCNLDKSDHMAAERHIANWVDQNRKHRAELNARFSQAGLQHDWHMSIRIAEWAYEQTARANGQVWIEKTILQRLGPNWHDLLEA